MHGCTHGQRYENPLRAQPSGERSSDQSIGISNIGQSLETGCSCLIEVPSPRERLRSLSPERIRGDAREALVHAVLRHSVVSLNETSEIWEKSGCGVDWKASWMMESIPTPSVRREGREEKRTFLQLVKGTEICSCHEMW